MFKKEKIEKQASEQLADIAGELVRQNRSRRRWSRFIFLIIVIYFGVLAYIGISESGIIDKILKKEKPFVAEVVLTGIIASDDKINHDDTVKLLENAFREPQSKAIILRLNSGGGSPVVAHQIYQAINRLKEHYNKKIFVVIDDICVSGCYLIASAADEIYADKSSIIGSIGVVISSFGVVNAMQKLGIERRLYTAGQYKGFLDPFSAEDTTITKHIQTEILDKSYRLFINYVKDGRGSRLKIDTPNLFSGLIWLGEQSKEFGLIDGIGDSYFVANNIIGIKNRVLFEPEKTLLEELTESHLNSILDYTNKLKLQ